MVRAQRVMDKVTKEAAIVPAAPTSKTIRIRTGSAPHVGTSTSTGTCAATHVRPRSGQVPRARDPRALGSPTCAIPRGRRFPLRFVVCGGCIRFSEWLVPLGSGLVAPGPVACGPPCFVSGPVAFPAAPGFGLLVSLGPPLRADGKFGPPLPRSSGAASMVWIVLWFPSP